MSYVNKQLKQTQYSNVGECHYASKYVYCNSIAY